MAIRLRKQRKARAAKQAGIRARKIRDLSAAVRESVLKADELELTEYNGRRVIKNIAAVNFGASMPEPEIKEGSKERPQRPTIDAKATHAKIWPNGRIEFIAPKQAFSAPLKPFEALPIGTNGNPALGSFAASHKTYWDKPEKKETTESRRIRTITQSGKLTLKEKGEKLRQLMEGSTVSHTRGAKVRVSPAEAQKGHGEQ